MPAYAVFFRGVMPANPAMSNDKLRATVESIGCTHVHSLLASGNLVFESTARSAAGLETKIEQALARKLGISLEAFVRARDELEALIQSDPFKGAAHGKEWYLTVTFFKDRRPPLCSKLERTKMDGPKFMSDLEKQHGKHITTRTWNTIQKIGAKMGGSTAD